MDFLIIWLVPTLLIVLLVYLGMEKKQSLEDYIFEQFGFEEFEFIFSALLSLVPFINIFIMLILAIKTLYNKIKHLTK